MTKAQHMNPQTKAPKLPLPVPCSRFQVRLPEKKGTQYALTTVLTDRLCPKITHAVPSTRLRALGDVVTTPRET